MKDRYKYVVLFESLAHPKASCSGTALGIVYHGSTWKQTSNESKRHANALCFDK